MPKEQCVPFSPARGTRVLCIFVQLFECRKGLWKAQGNLFGGKCEFSMTISTILVMHSNHRKPQRNGSSDFCKGLTGRKGHRHTPPSKVVNPGRHLPKPISQEGRFLNRDFKLKHEASRVRTQPGFLPWANVGGSS